VARTVRSPDWKASACSRQRRSRSVKPTMAVVRPGRRRARKSGCNRGSGRRDPSRICAGNVVEDELQHLARLEKAVLDLLRRVMSRTTKTTSLRPPPPSSRGAARLEPAGGGGGAGRCRARISFCGSVKPTARRPCLPDWRRQRIFDALTFAGFQHVPDHVMKRLGEAGGNELGERTAAECGRRDAGNGLVVVRIFRSAPRRRR